MTDLNMTVRLFVQRAVNEVRDDIAALESKLDRLLLPTHAEAVLVARMEDQALRATGMPGDGRGAEPVSEPVAPTLKARRKRRLQGRRAVPEDEQNLCIAMSDIVPGQTEYPPRWGLHLKYGVPVYKAHSRYEDASRDLGDVTHLWFFSQAKDETHNLHAIKNRPDSKRYRFSMGGEKQEKELGQIRKWVGWSEELAS